jgi:PTS system fructose-specific IIC component
MNHKKLGEHISTGFMKFIPFIFVYSILLALGSFDWLLSGLFQTGADYFYYLLIPSLSAFLAYSIGGYKTLIYAIILGVLAEYLGMGFLGALFVGLSLGYLVQYSEGKISLDHTFWNRFINDFVLPFLMAVFVGLVLWFLVAPPVVRGLESLTDMLKNLQQGSSIVLVMVLGALTAADLGGPLNKTSYGFSLGVFLEGLYHITGPAMFAVGIPPLSVGLAVYLFPKLFTKNEVKQRRKTIIFGFLGITEGAIPYAAKSPLAILPPVILGASLTSGFAAYLDLSSTMLAGALPGIIGTSNLFLYLLVHVIGISFTVMLIVVFKKLSRRNDVQVEEGSTIE